MISSLRHLSKKYGLLTVDRRPKVDPEVVREILRDGLRLRQEQY